MGALFLVASAVAAACFRDAPHSGYSFKYLVIPGVLWAALRFDLRITAIMNLIVALIVARLTTWNYGLLAQSSPVQEQQAASLQLFLAVGTLIGLFVTAIVNERRQAETAARESGENLAITLTSIGDAVIATDAAGCVVRMSPTAERLTGWLLAEAAGRPLTEVFHIVNAETRLEFAARIRALRVDLPVVIVSGYSPALTPERIAAAGVREVLSKPYTAGALAAVVHRQLHSGPPS